MNTKNRTLDAVVKEYDLTKTIVNEDLSGWDYRTVNGKLTAQRQAADELVKIRQQYNALLKSVTSIVFVYGGSADRRQEFTNHVEFLNNVPVYNTDSLYARLASSTEANLGKNREINAHSVSLITGEMTTLGKELGLDSYYPPRLSTPVPVATPKDTVAAVRDLVRTSSGDEMAALYFNDVIIKNAFNSGFNKPSLAVVVFCASKYEAQALSSRVLSPYLNKVLDLDTTDISAGFVSNLLLDAKKQIASESEAEAEGKVRKVRVAKQKE